MAKKKRKWLCLCGRKNEGEHKVCRMCGSRRTRKPSNIKTDLWYVFSQWARLRDADSEGIVICCTCGEKFHWKDVDAGHYIKRTYVGTFIHEKNVHPQCRTCNRAGGSRGGGREDDHALYIVNRYGKEALQELADAKKSRIGKGFRRKELFNLLCFYEENLNELKVARCLA